MINPWTIVGALLLLIAVGAGGAQVGRKLERSIWQKKEIETLEANQKALDHAYEEAHRAELFNQAKARKASSEHVQALNDINQKYSAALIAIDANGGLRISKDICNTTPTGNETTSTGRPNEANAGTVELPSRTQESLFALAKHADEIVAQCSALQNWIKDNGFYGESK